MDIKIVTVVGGGTMGNGIAHVCALSGREVRITDVSQDVLDGALATIAKNLDRQVNKGIITAAGRDEALERAPCAHPLTDVRRADVDRGHVEPDDAPAQSAGERLRGRWPAVSGATGHSQRRQLQHPLRRVPVRQVCQCVPAQDEDELGADIISLHNQCHQNSCDFGDMFIDGFTQGGREVADPIFWPWIGLLTVAGLSLLGTRRRRDWVQIAILALVAWQSALHLRHIAFLALLCGFWLPAHLQSALGRLRPQSGSKLPVMRLSPWMRRTALTVLVLSIGLQSFALVRRLTDFPVERNFYPVDAIQFMADCRLEGKLVVSFNW
ncbi:MAG: hypothetical protein IH921_06265, partial [Gemmatimonadetes bacterium]|nr:hypothetical protein [Gemmatimonadota bacterium]